MLLCAGLGTRLGALSDERPKPLLPVCDVPILRYGLALLEAAGLREVVINLHHRGDLIEHELRSGHGGLDLRYSREEILLGTGGGIAAVRDWLTGGGEASFLVLNGKLVLDADLADLARVHEAGGAEATMLLREVPEAERYGVVDFIDDGAGLRVVGLRGRRAPGFVQCNNLRAGMFTGVHFVSPGLAARLPDGVSDVIAEAYIPALLEGRRIAARLHAGYFQEHSTPARYLEGNLALLASPGAIRFPPAPLCGVDPGALVAPTARLVEPFRIGEGAVIGEGAEIGPGTVIGRGARVLAGARLARTVVWPDSVAGGDLHGAIVTPRGAVTVCE